MNGCMNSEKLMDALNLLDEDMAEEVGRLRERKPKKPSFMRYGMIAAGFCVTLLCVLQLASLMGRVPEDGIAVSGGQEEEITIENMEQTTSIPNESLDDLASFPENIPETEGSGDEEPGTEGSVGKDEGEESFDEGTEGVPDGEPLPALDLRIDGYNVNEVICTVVGNEGCTFYPVGSVVSLRFDIWEGNPITETTFKKGYVYSVLFIDDYGNSEENTLYAVDAYRLEE